GEKGVGALDCVGGVAMGNGFDLQGVQFAELGDLVERQRGVVQKPDSSRLRHQWCCGRHGKISSTLRPPLGRSTRSSMMIGKWPEYRGRGPIMQLFRLTDEARAPHVGG